MTFDEMKITADSFFEYPTENRDHVTTTSAVLFGISEFGSGVLYGRNAAARECLAIIGNQYPWLSDAITTKFGLAHN